MPEDHHITIDGRRWLLRFSRLRGSAAGWAYLPDGRNPDMPRKILVDERLKGGARLETILHEIAHAVLGPAVSEETVTELARVQRRALTMLGFKEDR